MKGYLTHAYPPKSLDLGNHVTWRSNWYFFKMVTSPFIVGVPAISL